MTQLFNHGYALLIGVGASAYSKWSLPVTVKDMQALSATLTDASLCGYPDDEAHIRLLHDAGATKQAILDGLTWLAERTAADPDATAVVFYSGHGWVDKASGRYYLVSHDVEPHDLAASALPAAAFTDALRQVQARRLLVFVDSCHAAGMATAKDVADFKLPGGFSQEALPKGLVEELKQGAGRAVFTSSLGQQRSWVRPDGSLSLYTYHLIEALKGAGSQPGDTTVRVSNLMNHLGKAVPASAQAMGKEQSPFFDAATEDFPVALLLGGKGLIGAGYAPAQDTAAPQPAIQASGEGSVAAETISDSAVVTGDRNVVQQGKYNINIGSVQGLVIGEGVQVTQVFGGLPPVQPVPSGSVAQQHLRQQLAELQGRYETLSKRIAALDNDIGRELDSERRLVLEERRGELASERAQVVSSMEDIARQLAVNAPATGSGDTNSGGGTKGEAKPSAGDPCPPVAKPADDVLYPFRHDSAGGLWGRMQTTRDTLQRNRSLLTRLQAQLQQAQLSNPLAVPAIELQIAQMQSDIDKTQSDLDIQAEVLSWLLHRDCLKQQALRTELDALLAKPQRNLTETRRVGEIKQELAELRETAQEAKPYLRELGVMS